MAFMISIAGIGRLLTSPRKTINDLFFHRFLGVLQLSHSSTGEDVILDWLIGDKTDGFYVDIGGYDPIFGNNTYLFYKKGWSGIVVEPNKLGYEKFRKSRPRDISLQLAAGSEVGKLEFKVFDVSPMSTCDKDAIERYLKAGHSITDSYDVQILPLREIFARHLPGNIEIDILSIDVEGWDMDVLESNDWNKYRPIYIILETVEYGKEGNGTWIKQNHIFDGYLADRGYSVVAETGINTIYKRNS